jgi:hypothetical protein
MSDDAEDILKPLSEALEKAKKGDEAALRGIYSYLKGSTMAKNALGIAMFLGEATAQPRPETISDKNTMLIMMEELIAFFPDYHNYLASNRLGLFLNLTKTTATQTPYLSVRVCKRVYNAIPGIFSKV